MIDTEFNRKVFIETAERIITRSGLQDLIFYLESSDFFEAPCSTRFHLSERGGLCQHSLNVFHALCTLIKQYELENKNPESLAIVSLFHDICKIDTYKETLQWRKNSNNEWEQYATYKFEEDFPFGHSEKSVYLISQFMAVSPYEAQAINGHMGFSDVRGSQLIGNIFSKNKLAVLLHFADMTATYFMED